MSTNPLIPCEGTLIASILCLYRVNSHFFDNEHQEGSFSFIVYSSLQWQQCTSFERKAQSLEKYLLESSQELFFIVFSSGGSSLSCSCCLVLAIYPTSSHWSFTAFCWVQNLQVAHLLHLSLCVLFSPVVSPNTSYPAFQTGLLSLSLDLALFLHYNPTLPKQAITLNTQNCYALSSYSSFTCIPAAIDFFI